MSFGTPEVNSLYISVIALCYLTIYLGIGKLLLDALRRATPVAMLTRLLLHIVLLALGSLVPLSIQLSSPTLRLQGYSLLQITNPFWTLRVFGGTSVPFESNVIVLLLVPAAAVVLLANLPSILFEVSRMRIAPPPRVAVDDAELDAARHPLAEVHTSPWD